MSNNNVRQLIIIGSGPAGLTAGIYCARANLNPIIIEGPVPNGQLMGTSYIENWPGEKKILGPDLMQKLRDQTEAFECEFISESVVKVDFSQRPFIVWTNKNKEFKAKSVIIATGASSKKLNCPGEKEYWGKGVTTCAVCDGAFYKDRPVIIAGGGDTAMEDASFMTKYTDKITIVHILDKLTASYTMQQRIINNPKIKIIYNSTITNITGDGQHINQVEITNSQTNQKQTLKTDVVFVAVGLNPNTQIFKDQIELDKMGYVVLKGITKTSVEGIFAAGDVADYRYRQAITSAGTGCMAALDVEHYINTIID